MDGFDIDSHTDKTQSFPGHLTFKEFASIVRDIDVEKYDQTELRNPVFLSCLDETIGRMPIPLREHTHIFRLNYFDFHNITTLNGGTISTDLDHFCKNFKNYIRGQLCFFKKKWLVFPIFCDLVGFVTVIENPFVHNSQSGAAPCRMFHFGTQEMWWFFRQYIEPRIHGMLKVFMDFVSPQVARLNIDQKTTVVEYKSIGTIPNEFKPFAFLYLLKHVLGNLCDLPKMIEKIGSDPNRITMEIGTYRKELASNLNLVVKPFYINPLSGAVSHLEYETTRTVNNKRVKEEETEKYGYWEEVEWKNSVPFENLDWKNAKSRKKSMKYMEMMIKTNKKSQVYRDGIKSSQSESAKAFSKNCAEVRDAQAKVYFCYAAYFRRKELHSKDNRMDGELLVNRKKIWKKRLAFEDQRYLLKKRRLQQDTERAEADRRVEKREADRQPGKKADIVPKQEPLNDKCYPVDESIFDKDEPIIKTEPLDFDDFLLQTAAMERWNVKNNDKTSDKNQ